MKIKIISWNVLHIIHEFNYCSDSSLVLNKYNQTKQSSNENNRLKDIVVLIHKILDNNTIVCLQEVPGDLLDILLNKLTGHTIYFNQYERQPKLKNDKIMNPYKNSYEYLVTIVPSKMITPNATQTTIEFKKIGKGALITKLDDLYIINSHFPPSSSQNLRSELFENINEFIKVNSAKKYIFIGDFNSGYLALKNDLNCAKFIDFKIPHIKSDTRKGLRNGLITMSKLDHIIVSNVNVCKTWATETDDLSDHLIIGGVIII